MPCNASGKRFPLASLTVLKGSEFLTDRMVSGNKLSVTKFVCPEPGCGKSVDVYFTDTDEVKVRHHAARGERVSMVDGKRIGVVKDVSLTSLMEMQRKQAEVFAAQMARALVTAEETIKSADLKIEAQLALIKQAETRIEQIKKDKVTAEEILTNPDFVQFRKAV